jgi:2-polyprenyl-3-methyl-5-hydroxy-6-metoxy-1,4-benzoquinol methylase
LSAQTKTIGQSSSPDENAAGLLKDALDPLRYAERILDPCVVSGIVVRMIPQGARILNVGCGTGALTEIVRDTLERLSLWRIEPDATRAAQAVAHGLNVRLGYLDRDMIREIGSFDVVLFADVLEQLPNPDRPMRHVGHGYDYRSARP